MVSIKIQCTLDWPFCSFNPKIWQIHNQHYNDLLGTTSKIWPYFFREIPLYLDCLSYDPAFILCFHELNRCHVQTTLHMIITIGQELGRRTWQGQSLVFEMITCLPAWYELPSRGHPCGGVAPKPCHCHVSMAVGSLFWRGLGFKPVVLTPAVFGTTHHLLY